jgi:hypothetical protein
MAETYRVKDRASSRTASPSFLRQIVDAADSLDDQGKAEILRKMKLQKALQLAKIADEMSKGNTLDLTEEEIVTIVDEDRRKRYNAN